MKIESKINIDIDVNPIDIINNLLEMKGNKIIKEGNKYYREYETYGGSHSWFEKEEVSEEEVEYINALKVVKKYIKKYKIE